MTYTYQFRDQMYKVSLEVLPDGSYQATLNDQRYRVQARRLSDGGWKLVLDADNSDVDGDRQQGVVYAALDGKYRYIQSPGETNFTLTVADMRAGRRRTNTAQSGTLNAQMPGQVAAVYVAQGDMVTQGQTLMVLEAMKMEIRISAPAAGIVKAIMARQGHVVEREQPLIEIAPSEAP